MSVGKRAASGALWSVAAGSGARVIGLIGTLAMTRLLAPEISGEVNAAAVLAQTASWVSNWGFNQYLVVHGGKSDEANYHAAVISLVFGVVGLSLIAGTGAWFAPTLHAPHLTSYLPGLALAVLIRRVGAVADKVLTRELRFRELAIANATGELLFTASAVTLAATTELRGQAIVIGNILQSTITTALILRATGLGWFRRTPWRWQRVWEIFRFGIPLGVAQVFNFATRYWDNLAISYYFGPGTAGLYNQAYNLADIPAVQVGEQMTGVLLPAMANLDMAERKAATVRSTGLMSLAVFPLAVGLGAVAPTLIRLILNDEWQGVAPLLTVLSVLSVVRPMGWGITAYLSSFSRTRPIMFLELLKLVLLFGCIAGFSWALDDPWWTATSVGIAFGVQSLATVVFVIRSDGFPAWPLAMAFLRPLAACAVMAAAVVGTREGMLALGVDQPAILLPIEIAVGAVTYVAAALVLARDIARDFLRLLRGALKRGK